MCRGAAVKVPPAGRWKPASTPASPHPHAPIHAWLSMNSRSAAHPARPGAPATPAGGARPTISVVMAAYQGVGLIERQVLSIVAQLDGDDELLILDDASTDGTVEVVRRLQSQYGCIVLHGNPENCGVIRTFESGIQMAKGDIIVLADQDDVFMPTRLDRCRDFFAQHPAADLLVQDCTEVDSHLATLRPSLFDVLDSGPGILKNLYRNTFLGATMVFRRSVVPTVVPFPQCIPMHDIWIGLAASLAHGVFFDRSVGILFVRHGKNQTPTRTPWGRRIRWRLCLAVHLLLRRMQIAGLLAHVLTRR